jgi:hypothetical protein
MIKACDPSIVTRTTPPGIRGLLIIAPYAEEFRWI